jgi:hypothetical protein
MREFVLRPGECGVELQQAPEQVVGACDGFIVEGRAVGAEKSIAGEDGKRQVGDLPGKREIRLAAGALDSGFVAKGDEERDDLAASARPEVTCLGGKALGEEAIGDSGGRLEEAAVAGLAPTGIVEQSSAGGAGAAVVHFPERTEGGAPSADAAAGEEGAAGDGEVSEGLLAAGLVGGLLYRRGGGGERLCVGLGEGFLVELADDGAPGLAARRDEIGGLPEKQPEGGVGGLLGLEVAGIEQEGGRLRADARAALDQDLDAFDELGVAVSGYALAYDWM